jgi:hypothetical protein
MKKILVILMSAFFAACSSAPDAKNEQESYQVTKEALLKKEEKSPVNFLQISGHNKKNLVGQTVVSGTMTNKASVATYKDVDLKLSFYSKTGALLESDRETIFEVYQPGQSKNFKTKYFAPKRTDSVALEVIGAKVIKAP